VAPRDTGQTHQPREPSQDVKLETEAGWLQGPVPSSPGKMPHIPAQAPPVPPPSHLRTAGVGTTPSHEKTEVTTARGPRGGAQPGRLEVGRLSCRRGEVGEPAWEVVSRRPVPSAGSSSLPEHGLPWQGVSWRSSPRCEPHAQCTMQPCAGQRSGTAGRTMQPFAKSTFLRTPFFFFPLSPIGPKGASRMPKTYCIFNS